MLSFPPGDKLSSHSTRFQFLSFVPQSFGCTFSFLSGLGLFCLKYINFDAITKPYPPLLTVSVLFNLAIILDELVNSQN
jgi:hypothetical protein